MCDAHTSWKVFEKLSGATGELKSLFKKAAAPVRALKPQAAAQATPQVDSEPVAWPWPGLWVLGQNPEKNEMRGQTGWEILGTWGKLNTNKFLFTSSTEKPS